MSSEVKRLRAQVAALEAQRARVTRRLLKIETACGTVAGTMRSLRSLGSFREKAAAVLDVVASDLASVRREFDRYHIEEG